MRKHGWQLPYHPLQVAAVSVFLALAFAFYVFFAPFVGKKLLQYISMGVYSPLILSVFGLYMWCAAADPADDGVFKSKKYLNHTSGKGKRLGQSVEDFKAENEEENSSLHCSSWLLGAMSFPCTFLFKCNNPSQESSDRRTSEDRMFYCSLCEVEVSEHSKHCRVCDKCVDGFDHHCRWLNNCIGKKNYREFFALMAFSLLLLIVQWLSGVLALISCFLDRKKFSADIASKLGTSFTIVPYVFVVIVCTALAMLATLALVRLFFFHILLIKKGLGTYDYIIALREQEQQTKANGGQQSPQMSQVSSFTGLSSASSFNTFHRGAWCTPPQLFMEDQSDMAPPETGSVSLYGKRMVMEKPSVKKNPALKISPWTLARLNAEEVSKAAAEARKKSKILQPVSSGQSNRMARLQIEPRSHFQPCVRGSSPESSLDSPDLHSFRVSSSGGEESRRLTGFAGGSGPFSAAPPGILFSGGNDSEWDPTMSTVRGGQESWKNLAFRSNQDATAIVTREASSSSSFSKTSNRNN